MQKSIAASVCGQELPLAVLDYIRHNDIPILEGCDKVLSKYQEELLTAESFAEFCDVMGKAVGYCIHTVESPNEGHFGNFINSAVFVPYIREVVLFSEVLNE